MSRESVAATKLKQPADASVTIWWRQGSTGVPMPVVHNAKSRARGLYDEAPKGRGRPANSACSWFVLALGIAMNAAVVAGLDLQTVICDEPTVSRESVAATKLKQPADASVTIWWRQFKQA